MLEKQQRYATMFLFLAIKTAYGYSVIAISPGRSENSPSLLWTSAHRLYCLIGHVQAAFYFTEFA